MEMKDRIEALENLVLFMAERYCPQSEDEANKFHDLLNEVKETAKN